MQSDDNNWGCLFLALVVLVIGVAALVWGMPTL